MLYKRFKYKAKTYYLSVLLATAVLWGIGGYMSFIEDGSGLYMIPMLLGLMTPAIVAIAMIWKAPEREMRRDFLRRLFDVRLVRPRVFTLALLVMPVSVMVSILISMAFGGARGQFAWSGAFSFESGFIPVLALLMLAALFEELGWRGYGFECLEQKRSFWSASLVFGILWSAWHLPLLWVKGSYQYEIYQESLWFALNFYAGTALMGVVVSWVCVSNNRSILATIVFHFMINISQEALSMTQATKCIQTLVLLVFVLGLWVITSRKDRALRPAGSLAGTGQVSCQRSV